MKIAVSTYSFGKYAGSLGYKEILRLAKEYGAEGIDVSGITGTHEERIELAGEISGCCADLGLGLACYCTGGDFVNGSGGDLDAEIEKICREVDVAGAFGFKTLRHDCAYGPRKGEVSKKSFDSCLPRIIEGARRVTEYAASLGIVTCTENHGFFSQDSARVEKIINGVGNDNFGALVDIGNFMCADEEPKKAVSIMAGYARHVHVKDFYFRDGSLDDPGEGWFRTRCRDYIKGAILGHGAVPVRQCLGILKNAGYDGWLSLEFEGMEDNLKAIRISVANLKRTLENI